MRKEIFEDVKKELFYLLIIFIIVFIILKTAFYNENLLILIRNAVSIFWMFALPGYCILIYWRENLGFTERFVVGAVLAAGINEIFSYYFGLIGLNIKYHVVLLPLLMIIVGFVLGIKALNSESKRQNF